MNNIERLLKILPPFSELCSIKNLSVETNTIHIHIDIISYCNFSCSYCYINNTTPNQLLDMTKLYKYLMLIHEYKQTHSIHIHILGGEPTLHPQLFEFCKLCEKLEYIKIIIYTNLTSDIAIYIQLMSLKNISFIFSWHSQNRDFYKKIVQIKKYIPETVFDESVIYIMYEHENIQLAKTLFNLLYKLNINIELQLIDIWVYKKNPNIYSVSEIHDAINMMSVINTDKTLLLTYNNTTEKISEFEYACLIYFNYIKTYYAFKCYSSTSMYIHNNGNIYSCISQYYLNKNCIGTIEKPIVTFIDTCKCCKNCYFPQNTKFQRCIFNT